MDGSGRRLLPVAWSAALIGAMAAWTPARAEPPIRSPEDAACRLEAKARVFSAPNPHGLEIEELGKRIYYACMARISPSAKGTHRARRHRRHHRR